MLGVDGASEKEYAVKNIQTHDNITRCRFKSYQYHVHHTVHACVSYMSADSLYYNRNKLEKSILPSFL